MMADCFLAKILLDHLKPALEAGSLEEGSRLTQLSTT